MFAKPTALQLNLKSTSTGLSPTTATCCVDEDSKVSAFCPVVKPAMATVMRASPAVFAVTVHPASNTSPTRTMRGMDGSNVTGRAATKSRSADAYQRAPSLVREPETATALMRHVPTLSGLLNFTVALPDSSASTRPRNRAVALKSLRT